ncbi:uncharacterized protein LOC135084888 isoform X1 [Ostrinia nubilalis]|uniref:uncharacterized protein LOC135084888 isoform X1 n=2 Tax=Ostrinia nubilalis TaxID=29057 RepID=UPI0030824F36
MFHVLTCKNLKKSILRLAAKMSGRSTAGPSTSSGVKRRSNNEDEQVSKVSKTSAHRSNSVEYVVTMDLAATAFEGQTSTYRITVESADGEVILNDPQVILNQALTKAKEEIIAKIDELSLVKIIVNLHGCFIDNQYNAFDINGSVDVFDEETVDDQIDELKMLITSKFNVFDRDNEGDKQLLYIDLHINKHVVPDFKLDIPWHLKRYIVNVMSDDYPEQSFKWAVLAALHREIHNPQDYLLEEFSEDIILTNIQHPVKLHDIPKIEEMNDMSFNVYILNYNFNPNKREEIEGPVYHTARRRNKHFNLLLLHGGASDCYCLISDLKGLVVDTNNFPISYGDKLCDGCLNIFKKESLMQHQQDECLRKKTVLASHDAKHMKYIRKKSDFEKMPFVVYADFEAYLEPVSNSTNMKKKQNKETYTINVNKHVPYSFAYYIKCAFDDQLSTLKSYDGKDCAEQFFKMLREDLADIRRKTDKFSSVIPVFFHNFSNYDGHFICRVLDAENGEMSCLGSKHNYVAMHKKLTIGQYKVELRFLDSRKFLQGSIAKLLKKINRELFFESCANWEDSEKFELMTQKGVFPYEYIKSIEQLEETSLPPIEQFYNSVNDAHIEESDYQRALEVWDIFECETIGDYSRLYSQSDALILADLFENLRNTCIEAYNLDPANYYAISGLSWDAMLMKTGVELELLTDVEMVTFMGKLRRGGIAHCTRRHAVANNKYLPDYDEWERDNFIMYYDANNLYGWAMSQPLPYGGFKWVKDCTVKWVKTKVLTLPVDSNVGYFLEVDLKYPKELHDSHADYPFCPEKKKVPDCDDDRLVADLTSKTRYTLHHSYLIQCLKNGLKLEKVHRVLKFKQRPWLKPYIDFNAEKRKAATCELEEDFYKLMNNSIAGKSMQNDENYFNLKIIDNWFHQWKNLSGHSLVGGANYHSHAVINDNLMMIQLNKTKREFKNPIYIGFSVYDLSKAYMYDFHYNFMKPKYGNKLKLLYTDTDSFIYQIYTKDYYSEIRPYLAERFDTSNYPEDNALYSQENKMKLGFFKDELKGDVVKEFVALRPKVYMIQSKNDFKRKAAGVPEAFSKKFTMEDYKKCLREQKKDFREMFRIQPVGNDIYTQKVRKVALSPAYFNRQLLKDGINSLPFGHYSLMENPNLTF